MKVSKNTENRVHSTLQGLLNSDGETAKIASQYLQEIGRTDADDKDGRWVTTESGKKMFINGEGEPTKGNPHVLAAAKGESKSSKSGGKAIAEAFKTGGKIAKIQKELGISDADMESFIKENGGDPDKAIRALETAKKISSAPSAPKGESQSTPSSGDKKTKTFKSKEHAVESLSMAEKAVNGTGERIARKKEQLKTAKPEEKSKLQGEIDRMEKQYGDESSRLFELMKTANEEYGVTSDDLPKSKGRNTEWTEFTKQKKVFKPKTGYQWDNAMKKNVYVEDLGPLEKMKGKKFATGDVATVTLADGTKKSYTAKWFSKPGFNPGFYWEDNSNSRKQFGTSGGTLAAEFRNGVIDVDVRHAK